VRILLVSQFFAPVTGGEERIVEDLATELTRRGHDVAIATTTATTPEMNGPRIHRVRPLIGRLGFLHSDDARRHVPPVADPEAVRDLRRIIALERPQVVHAHNWLVYSAIAAAEPGTPVVLTLHDYGLVCANKRMTRRNVACDGPGPVKCITCSVRHYGALKGAITSAALRLGQRSVLGGVDMFLPVSRAVAERSRLPQAGLPFEVIPNFMSRPTERPAPPASDAGGPAGLPPGDFIAFAGDITYDKGVEALLRAHALLDSPPPLVLAGRVLMPEDRLARPGVRVLGPRTHREVIDIFRRSLAVVVPSLWSEPFGLVSLEAMATGTPVVASRVGGIVEIVDDDETGILTRPGDEHEIAGALARLIGSPTLRARMGQAAMLRAADFRADVIVPRIEAVYRRLCSSSPQTLRPEPEAVG
jgi:glycosyltransferase involved in cell wall biosynthesis